MRWRARGLQAAGMSQPFRIGLGLGANAQISRPWMLSGLQFAYEFFTAANLKQLSTGVTAVSANNDPVGYVTDLGSGHNNGTQATSGKRPLFKTNIINSLPTVSGTTTGQYLDTPVTFSNAKMTVICVAKCTLSTMALISHNAATSTNNFWFGEDSGSSYLYNYLGDNVHSQATQGMTVINGTTGIFSVVVNMSYPQTWINGAFDGTGAATQITQSALWAGNVSLTVGSTDYRGLNSGNILAMYVFNRALSPGEREAIEAYLSGITGIAVTRTLCMGLSAPFVVQGTVTNTWITNSGANTAAECIFPFHPNRIRQNGTLYRVGMKIAALTGITGFYFKVWRKTGTNSYDLVGTSDDVTARLPAAGKTGYVTLNSPITTCQEGDMIGYRVEWSGGASVFNFYTAASGGQNSYFVFNTTPSTTAYAWESQSSTTNYQPLILQMGRPYFIAIGDSLMAGHPDNFSYIETTDTNAITHTIEYQLSQRLTNTPPYQNLGIGGQTTTQLAARIGPTILDQNAAAYVILEGGVNDVSGGVLVATFTANWTTILNAVTAQGIVPVVLLIFPWSAGTNTQMATRDTFNAALVTLCVNYPTAIVVNLDPIIGQFRSAGSPAPPAGNFWDIQTALDAGDGLHLNSTGYGLVAKAIYDAGVR